MSKHILLPGPSIKGSVNITDLDIEVGMGMSTVISESCLNNPVVQNLIKQGCLISEPYDPSLRRREMPYGPYVKVTQLYYGEHKVGVRFAAGESNEQKNIGTS